MSSGDTLWGDPPDAESVRFGGSSWGSSPWGAQHIQQNPPQSGAPRGQLPPQFLGMAIEDDGPQRNESLGMPRKPAKKGFEAIQRPGLPPLFKLFGDLSNVRP